ncbi:MAG: IMPACT family protein [Mycoplasma sp.]
MIDIKNRIQIDIKKSKFITYYLSVDKVDELNDFIKQKWVEHKKAAHICFAYKIIDGSIQIKVNDDGEPKGTAGYPMLSIIERNNLSNIAIVVIRYFGGTKLGAGPLLRAYSKSASEVIKSVD